MKKINVLISAHEFSPYQGSECAVGWNIILNLAANKSLNLFVLYAEGSQESPFFYKDSINKFRLENDIPNNIELIEVKQPKLTVLISRINIFIFRKMGGLGFPVLYFLGYTLWQKQAFKQAKIICSNKEINIIHNLTQISFREPGYYWKLNIPLVWGPIGGFSNVAKGILIELNWKDKLFEMIRNVSNFYQFNIKSRVNKTLKRANLIYLVSEEDKESILNFNKNVKIMIETGVHVDIESKQRTLKLNEKMRLLWVGRLENRKSLDILLYALNQIQDINNRVELKIIGDGPLKMKYITLAEQLNLKCVTFVGKIAHNEVNRNLKDSHLLVHTSYREGTPHVILEAISTGLPVLCHDIGGLSYAVNESTGIKLPLINKATSSYNFSLAILKLLEDRELISNLSKGAMLRRHELTWGKIAERISDDYKIIVS